MKKLFFLLLFVPSICLAADQNKTQFARDQSTGALVQVDYPHSELHGGDHFYISGYSGTLNNGDKYELVITTPNTTKWAHVIYEFQSILGMTYELYEGAVASSSATHTIFNNNRNSSVTSGLTAGFNSTVTSDGTMIRQRKFGSSSASARVGGEVRGDSEIILKQNTTYLLRCTSNANANYVSGVMSWYEHTSR